MTPRLSSMVSSLTRRLCINLFQCFSEIREEAIPEVHFFELLYHSPAPLHTFTLWLVTAWTYTTIVLVAQLNWVVKISFTFKIANQMRPAARSVSVGIRAQTWLMTSYIMKWTHTSTKHDGNSSELLQTCLSNYICFLELSAFLKLTPNLHKHISVSFFMIWVISLCVENKQERSSVLLNHLLTSAG